MRWRKERVFQEEQPRTRSKGWKKVTVTHAVSGRGVKFGGPCSTSSAKQARPKTSFFLAHTFTHTSNSQRPSVAHLQHTITTPWKTRSISETPARRMQWSTSRWMMVSLSAPKADPAPSEKRSYSHRPVLASHFDTTDPSIKRRGRGFDARGNGPASEGVKTGKFDVLDDETTDSGARAVKCKSRVPAFRIEFR